MATSRSRVRVEVENLDEVLRKLEPGLLVGNPMVDMYEDLGATVRRSLEQTTTQLAYRTGNLAGSYAPFGLWKFDDIPHGGAIVNPVEYGPYVDQGTKYIKPRRFLRKTATKSRGDADNALRKLVKKVESKWRI